MAMIIKVNGTVEHVVGEGESGELTYEQIREAIGGGFIERVMCNPEVTEGHDHFYCDAEGKLKSLPVNIKATELSTYTSQYDVVCGDVIFVQTRGEDEF